MNINRYEVQVFYKGHLWVIYNTSCGVEELDGLISDEFDEDGVDRVLIFDEDGNCEEYVA